MSFLLALSLLTTPADAASVLTFRSDAPVHLYVDGKKAASTTMGRAAELRLDPGSHTLRLESITGRVLHSDNLKLDDHTAVETRWHRRNFEVMGAVQLPNYHKAEEEDEAAVVEEVPVEEPVDNAVLIGATPAPDAPDAPDETDDAVADAAPVEDALPIEDALPGEVVLDDAELALDDDTFVLISGPIEEVADDAPLAIAATPTPAATPVATASRQAAATRQPALMAVAPLPESEPEEPLVDDTELQSAAVITPIEDEVAPPSALAPPSEIGVDLSNPDVAWSGDMLHLTFKQNGGEATMMSIIVSPDRVVVTDAQGAAQYAANLTPDDATPVDPNAPGSVQFFTRDGQWANVYINGEVAAYIANDAQATLDLEPGDYAIELRDARGKEIWHKGTLTVQPGKVLEIGFAQTLAPQVQGAKDAWRPAEGSTEGSTQP